MTKLGQNFLKSRKIVEEIIKAAELIKKDIVLEVGPGKGILTEALLEHAGKVIAVEKDKKLFDFLCEKFKNEKNLELICDDILKIENWKLKIKDFKIVANIPYYITSRFLRQFLSAPPADGQPLLMVLMLQKEVAERIVARDKKESILSISVKAYGTPKIIKKVPSKCFFPEPKVGSAIIKVDNISKNFFIYRSGTSIDEKKFFEMVRRGFSSKRKMLKNNLKISSEELKKLGLNEKIRAEELSPEDWKHLYSLVALPNLNP